MARVSVTCCARPPLRPRLTLGPAGQLLGGPSVGSVSPGALFLHAAAYGWDDLDLGQDFHETDQGTRYTLSPPARRAPPTPTSPRRPPPSSAR